MKERVFTPAGMSHTSLPDLRSLEHRRAAGYEYDLVPGFENASFVDASNMVGGGGMLSTVDDLHRWVRALSVGRLLPEPWLAEMRRSQVAVDPDTGYGYGWFVSASPDGEGAGALAPGEHERVHELRLLGPPYGRAGRSPEQRPVERPPRATAATSSATLREGIRSILAGGTVAPPKRSAVMAVSPVAVASGGTAAVEAYRRLRRDPGGDHYFDELELNALGLELLFKQGRVDDALAILALNVEEHPDSYNVYDTMGYVLRQEGRVEDSLACYREGIAVFEADPVANEAYRSDYEKAVSAGHGAAADVERSATRGRRRSRAGCARR